MRHLKRYRSVYSYLLIAVFIALFVYYFNTHREQFRALSIVSPEYLILITSLAVLFRVVLGLKFKAMIGFFDVRFRLAEWIGLPSISSMINYFLPARFGIAVQAVYMKKVHKFEYTKFATCLAGFLVFTLAANSFSGILFLLLYYIRGGEFFLGLFAICLACFGISLVMILLMPYLSRLKLRWEIPSRIAKGFRLFKERRPLVGRFLFIQFLDIIISGLRLYLAYRVLGANVYLLPVMIVGLLANSSALLGLTPANLGLREICIAALSVMIGAGATVGIMASLIDRATGLVVTFIFGTISMAILMPGKKIKVF